MKARVPLALLASSLLLLQLLDQAPEPAAPLRPTSRPPSRPAAPTRSHRFDEESGWDALGRTLSALPKLDPRRPIDLSLPASAEDQAPDLCALLNRHLRELQGLPPLPSSSEEEEIAYAYLFGSAPRARTSLLALGRWVCFWRLNRLWPGLHPSRGASSLPAWATCPEDGEPYRQVQAPAAPSLSCPTHDLQLTPGHLPAGLPTEVSMQLALGYFSAERGLNLEEALAPEVPSGILPGQTVIDLGCGVGCYTWPMARQAGPEGLVVAVDIDPGVLDFVEFVARRRAPYRVETVLAHRDDPRLPPGQADVIYMVDVYHVIVGPDPDRDPHRRRRYLSNLFRALRPEGRLVVVDFVPQPGMFHLDPTRVTADLETFGLRRIDHRQLRSGLMYVLTFQRS